jgi:glycosyltransferase involved in cell wall biosynthesis
MKILYLYSELMGYQIPIFKEYVNKYGASVDVVYWDKNKYTNYIPPKIEGVNFHKKSQLNFKDLSGLTLNNNYSIIYISGWMDFDYLKIVFAKRKKGIPVVTGFDDIWRQTIKQNLAAVFFPFIKSFFFSHAWVAGPLQFEYAKKLGFKNSEIIFNCLSADINLFNNVYQETKDLKELNYPHVFLYAGRFEKVKGVDILVTAWRNLLEKGLTKDWKLELIGSGTLIDEINIKGINLRPFMNPQELASNLSTFGCYILPSRFEQWALVIHEFAAAGFPIICSDICGAAPVFVTKSYNGYTFESENIEDLEFQMLRVINSTDESLIEMSRKSHFVGQKINPELSAASFISILND